MANSQQDLFIALSQDASYAAAVLDGSFNILWRNENATNSYPFSAGKVRFPFADLNALARQLAIHKTVSVRIDPFPESGRSVIFSLLENSNITAVLCGDGAPFLGGSVVVDGVDAFSSYVRANMQEAFISMSVVKSTPDDAPEHNEHLLALERTNYKMLRMAANMSVVSRYLSGAAAPSLELCDVGEVARELCESVKRVVVSPVALRWDIPDSPCVAALDRELFENGIMNLLLNAYTFTRDGNAIDVSMTVQKDTIALSIKDRGAGIRPEILPRVTEPYFSSDPYGDGERPGLGLGLSVAAVMAQLHGGTLVVDSEFGAGTTVGFTISCAAAGEHGNGELRASMARYVTDRFSPVYIGLCEICDLP